MITDSDPEYYYSKFKKSYYKNLKDISRYNLFLFETCYNLVG